MFASTVKRNVVTCALRGGDGKSSHGSSVPAPSAPVPNTGRGKDVKTAKNAPQSTASAVPPPNAWQQFTAAKPVEAGILSGTALTAVSVLAATVASRAYVARVNAREGGLQRNKAAFMLAKTFGVPPQTYLGSVEGFASQLQEARGREESLCKEVRQLQEYAQAMQERYDSAQNHRRSLEDSLGQLEQDLNALRQLEERERLGWQAEEAGMRRQMRSLEERAESLGVMKERSEAELQMLQDQIEDLNRALTSQRREIQTVRDQLAKAEAVKERVKTLEREIAERDKKLARTVADLTERDRLLADNAAALKSLQSYRSLYDEMKANMDRTMREAPPKPRGDTPAPSTSYAAAPPAAAAVDPQRAARPAVGTAVLERSALKLSAALAMRPHINKVAKGGEDAALVLDRHLIVADGVGSWGDEGVDPSLYSRSLVQNVAKGLQKGRSVILAMDEAHKQTKAAGSATLCVAAFDEKRGRLTVASLGDSQVKIVRGGRVVFASEVRQHSFNQPFQMASPSTNAETDTAADASVQEVELAAGDVVVMGSDGLFDNMWNDELTKTVTANLRQGPQGLANALVNRAFSLAQDQNFRSPYCEALEKSGKVPLMYKLTGVKGGKMDDVTAVVACIS